MKSAEEYHEALQALATWVWGEPGEAAADPSFIPECYGDPGELPFRVMDMLQELEITPPGDPRLAMHPVTEAQVVASILGDLIDAYADVDADEKFDRIVGDPDADA